MPVSAVSSSPSYLSHKGISGWIRRTIFAWACEGHTMFRAFFHQGIWRQSISGPGIKTPLLRVVYLWRGNQLTLTTVAENLHQNRKARSTCKHRPTVVRGAAHRSLAGRFREVHSTVTMAPVPCMDIICGGYWMHSGINNTWQSHCGWLKWARSSRLFVSVRLHAPVRVCACVCVWLSG